MPEIADFVTRGAASVSHAVVDKVVRQLPHWKLEFSQINAPKFPHLVDQLEFLANAVEDAQDGTYKDLPFTWQRPRPFRPFPTEARDGRSVRNWSTGGRSDAAG